MNEKVITANSHFDEISARLGQMARCDALTLRDVIKIIGVISDCIIAQASVNGTLQDWDFFIDQEH